MSTSHSVGREYPTRPTVSAHAIVLRDKTVLLVKRAHPPSLGRWSAPGGMVEIGETVRDAARREVREECGIEVQVGTVVDVADNIIPDETGLIRFHYVVVYLLAHYVGGEARPGSDAADVLWATREEVPGLDMHPALRGIVFHAFNVAPRVLRGGPATSTRMTPAPQEN